MTTTTAMPMDLTSRPPETDDQTTPPPLLSKPKPLPLSFSNGSLKRHHHHQPPPPPPRPPLYRECLKNHAAALGGHALDGCGEFMPSPHSNPSDPTSLKCAACGCHRNFHRRDDDDDADGENEDHDIDDDDTDYLPHPIQLPPKRHNSHSPPPYLTSSAPDMLLALSTRFSAPPDVSHHPYPTTPGTNRSSSSSGARKRFRTKFSKEQKERMQEFSENLGWRMQKQDEEAVEGFCREIGVSKGVFKVWMHNNKNSFVKRDQISSSSLISNNDNNIIISRDNHVTNTTSVITSNSNVDMTATDNDGTRSTNAHLPTNASSPSS